jgi:hypothetical protein
MGAGELSNIRVMAGGSGSVPYAAWPPQYAGGARPSNPWLTAAQAAPAGCVDAQNCPLFEVGATCFYTLQTLATLGVGVPLGLLDLAIGGQRIEEYASNASLAECTAGLNSQNIPWWNAQLYGQQTLMFTDMTVAGWLWCAWRAPRAPRGGRPGRAAQAGPPESGCEARRVARSLRRDAQRRSLLPLTLPAPQPPPPPLPGRPAARPPALPQTKGRITWAGRRARRWPARATRARSGSSSAGGAPRGRARRARRTRSRPLAS